MLLNFAASATTAHHSGAPLSSRSLKLSPHGPLSLSYLPGRRRWRSPWPSWPEPWPAPAEWGRSSPPRRARSGTSGSETRTLRATETEMKNLSEKPTFALWSQTEAEKKGEANVLWQRWEKSRDRADPDLLKTLEGVKHIKHKTHIIRKKNPDERSKES